MSTSAETGSTLSCASCSASVYQEHLDRGLAGMWAGEILCPHCLAERRQPVSGASSEDGLDSLPLMEGSAVGVIIESETTELHIDRESAPAPTLPGGADWQGNSPAGRGARRIRIFHARLSEGAVGHLNGQVNKWLETNPGIEIKFATTTVGVWEGKHAEPNLILTIFY